MLSIDPSEANPQFCKEFRASERGVAWGTVEDSVDSGVDILPPHLSMVFLTPRNMLQNLVLCVSIVVFDSGDGGDLFLLNVTKSYLLAIFEQKLSSSSSVSDQAMWKEI